MKVHCLTDAGGQVQETTYCWRTDQQDGASLWRTSTMSDCQRGQIHTPAAPPATSSHLPGLSCSSSPLSELLVPV
ncbi:hypothetical protein NQZ68_024340 [Dissostichus eleginoides]|nr:hypothetical protein NQZ68_024340 [Dissostichus eleginoides]